MSCNTRYSLNLGPEYLPRPVDHCAPITETLEPADGEEKEDISGSDVQCWHFVRTASTQTAPGEKALIE